MMMSLQRSVEELESLQTALLDAERDVQACDKRYEGALDRVEKEVASTGDISHSSHLVLARIEQDIRSSREELERLERKRERYKNDQKLFERRQRLQALAPVAVPACSNPPKHPRSIDSGRQLSANSVAFATGRPEAHNSNRSTSSECHSASIDERPLKRSRLSEPSTAYEITDHDLPSADMHASGQSVDEPEGPRRFTAISSSSTSRLPHATAPQQSSYASSKDSRRNEAITSPPISMLETSVHTTYPREQVVAARAPAITKSILDDDRRTTRCVGSLRGWSYLNKIPVIVYSWHGTEKIMKRQWYSMGCKRCHTNIKGDSEWFIGPNSLHRHLMAHREDKVRREGSEEEIEAEPFDDAMMRCGHLEPLSLDMVEFLERHPQYFPKIRNLKLFDAERDFYVAPEQWMDVRAIASATPEWSRGK